MNEIFRAVYERLSSQLADPVKSHVPQDYNVFPYVRIDPLSYEAEDVDDKAGFSAEVQIIGFSRYRGSKEAARLNQNIYDALHRYAFADTTSYGISDCILTFSTIALESDGKTYDSIQRFNITYEPL